MKQLLALVAVALALYIVIDVMADATQNRPDEVAAGSVSVVDFKVSADDFQRGEPAAADALWAVCAATVSGDVSPRPARVGDHWRVTVSPAFGENGEKRLVGCLEDLTLDRVVGNVVSVRGSD